MGIEQDIHQSNFRSTKQKAVVNLLYTYGWTIERIKSFPLSTLQIRERMLDKMSDTSRIVDRLLVKGLVKKSTCSKDKRLVDVVITEKGQKLLKKLDTEDDHINKVMDNLTENEAEMLSNLLDKVRSI
jgi:DNA-binding MarR family transcriptional regulator